MKMKFTLLVLAGFSALVLLPGCLRDTCTSTRTYVRFDPVYKTLEECRVGISVEAPRALKQPGKIYSINKYILITEINEGIHVIDNSDPANPRPVVFWKIPGNVDMAIRDHYLYADQYIDLLTIDIEDIQQPVVVCRADNVFALNGFDPSRGYLVDYTQTEVTEEIPCDDPRGVNNWFWQDDVLFAFDASSANSSNGPIRKLSACRPRPG